MKRLRGADLQGGALMIKERICREYLIEIARLRRSVEELEREIVELKMQIKMKTEDATNLAIENASLRHKVELLEKREKAIMEAVKKMRIPIIIREDQ